MALPWRERHPAAVLHRVQAVRRGHARGGRLHRPLVQRLDRERVALRVRVRVGAVAVVRGAAT